MHYFFSFVPVAEGIADISDRSEHVGWQAQPCCRDDLEKTACVRPLLDSRMALPLRVSSIHPQVPKNPCPVA